MDGEPYWMGDTQDGKEKKMDSIETIQKKHREGVEYVETALAVEAIEKAREEERGRILDILDRRYSVEEDDIDELGACITTIKSLGPVSSIEDRVRRETVKKFIAEAVPEIDDTGYTIGYKIYRGDLDRIAEGGEG